VERVIMDAYGLDPNSQHQMWSRWSFEVISKDKLPSIAECVDNFRRYIAGILQTTVGRVRVDRINSKYLFMAEVEGPPAHDPDLRVVIHRAISDFTFKGFGVNATTHNFEVGILAGDEQDGRPPDQLLVMPAAILFTSLHTPGD
jgi:hypothetical protein